jgi:hypothetical protein
MKNHKLKRRGKICPAQFSIGHHISVHTKKNSVELVEQLGEKYFDYIIDYSVNCGLPHSGARHRALAQTIGDAWGLDINSLQSAETHTEDLRF